MMDISIVIPAYNEEKFIVNTVQSIQQWMPEQYKFEVIVVDHGSTDSTASLVESIGARVIDGAGLKTIAALRNFGVKQSTGQILIFIDADITLTEEWSDNISKVLETFDETPAQICGSHPNIPADSASMIKRWFEPKTLEDSPTHIGSCHLITSRKLFEEINGFPEHMETSEEFNFCLDAKSAGAKIVSYPELTITHHGAPKTLADFIKSELWHGRGDWTSIDSMMSSKVALLTVMFIFLNSLLISSVYFIKEQPEIFLSFCLAIAALCFASSIIKFYKHGFTCVIFNSLTFYFYFLGRSLSLFSALFSKGFGKRSRAG